MAFIYNRPIKIISAIVLFFFLWTFGGVFEVAYAFKNSDQPSAVSSQGKQKEKRVEEKFQDALEKIRDAEERAHKKLETGEDTEKEESEVRSQKTELEKHDIEIKKQFRETEDKIKGLPEEIKLRHKKFVEKYEENLKTLKTNLEDIERAKTKGEKEQAHKKTKEFLEKTKPPSRHTPLDPNKLPHRTAEPVWKEPRTKPEEFEKDSGQLSAFSRQLKKPILVASNGPLTGLLNSTNSEPSTQNYLQLALATPPSTAELAETIEIQFTPEIQAKAQELGNNPVKIYNWVRNNIEYVPTYGSIQGANYCLQTKQCNDFDTASLLIALLRASNIPAKYVYGTIEIPIEKVMNWVGGFTDPKSALNLIASGGIPVTGLTSGGKIVMVRMEHVWVEAYVDYIPSRGAVHKQGDTWIPLEASFKQFTYKKGIDVKSITGFDPQSFTNGITAASTIDPVTGSVTNIPTTEVQNQIDAMTTTLKNYIDINMPNATVGDVFGGRNIVQQNYRILPASLPFEVIVTGNKYSQIPDNLRHKITITMEDPYGINQPLSYSALLPQIALKRLTLGYIPATAQDAQTMMTYGYYNVPPYLVNLKPVLYIDGIATAQGGSLGMGETQALTITFAQPGRGAETVSHSIAASSFAAIGLDMQRIPVELLTQRSTRLKQALSQLGQQEVAVDDITGEILNLHSLTYFYQVEVMNRLAAQGKIAYTKKPAEMLTTLSPRVAYLYGVPYSISGLGMGVDVKRYVMSPVSLSGNKH